MSFDYEKHLSEPWFTLIKLGEKTVECRLNKGDFAQFEINNKIQFFNDDFGYKRKLIIIITNIRHYTNFSSYLKKEKLHKCLPGIDTIQHGVDIYHKYYPKELVEEYGIIAFKFKLKN